MRKKKVGIYANPSQCLGFSVKLILLILAGILTGANRAVWAVGKARHRQKSKILILFTGRNLLVLCCCSCSHADPWMWQLPQPSHGSGPPDCHLGSVPGICEMEFKMLPKEKWRCVSCFTPTREAAHQPLGCPINLLRWQRMYFSFFKKPCLPFGRIRLKIAAWFPHVAQTWNNFTQICLPQLQKMELFSCLSWRKCQLKSECPGRCFLHPHRDFITAALELAQNKAQKIKGKVQS